MAPLKGHTRSKTRILNVVNRLPTPISVAIGIVIGLLLARIWFGEVRGNYL
jgi:chromate transport protein ChrA